MGSIGNLMEKGLFKSNIDSCKNQEEVGKVIRDELDRINDLAVEFSIKIGDYVTAEKLKELKDKRKK